MRSRRLLSSLAGSLVVAALMGCNAIVGNEDITYTDPSDPDFDDEEPTNESPPGSKEARPSELKDSGSSDVKDAPDEDHSTFDAPNGDAEISDGGTQG